MQVVPREPAAVDAAECHNPVMEFTHAQDMDVRSPTAGDVLPRYLGYLGRFVDPSFSQNQTGDDSRADYEDCVSDTRSLPNWRVVMKSAKLMAQFGGRVPVLFPFTPSYSRRMHAATFTFNYEAPVTHKAWRDSIDDCSFRTLFEIKIPPAVVRQTLYPSADLERLWFVPLVIIFDGDNSVVENTPPGALFAMQLLSPAHSLLFQDAAQSQEQRFWLNGDSAAPRETVVSGGPDAAPVVHNVGFSFSANTTGQTQLFSADAAMGTRAFRTLTEARRAFEGHTPVADAGIVMDEPPADDNSTTSALTWNYVRHHLVGSKTHLTRSAAEAVQVGRALHTSTEVVRDTARELYDRMGIGERAPIVLKDDCLTFRVCLLSSGAAWDSYLAQCTERRMDNAFMTFNLKLTVLGVFV